MLMVERIVGEVTFRDGLRLFLNQFMYRNVDHTDLLAALTRLVARGQLAKSQPTMDTTN